MQVSSWVLDWLPRRPRAVVRSARDRRLAMIRFAISAFGYVLMGLVFLWAARVGDFGFDITTVYQPAGEAFRSGAAVYVYSDFQPYLYSPPVTVLIGLATLLPGPILFLIVEAANVLALRYVAGGWLRVGYLLWLPPVWFELLNGNVNLLMAGALLLAVRAGASSVGSLRSGAVALPTLLSFAKFSPVLAVDPRRWGGVVAWSLIALVVTLPWLHLWPEWIDQLQHRLGEPVGPLVPVPLWVRAPLGLLLVATQRRLGRALGAAIATPAFYWTSSVLLLAPLAVWLDDREKAGAGTPSTADGPSR